MSAAYPGRSSTGDRKDGPAPVMHGNVVLAAPTSVGVQATLVSPKDKNVTLYVILVKWGSNKVWTVNHRFSEFEALYDKLSADLQSIPPLPKKTFWGAMDPGVVAKRRADLDVWLNVVVKEPYVLNNVWFQNFLQFQENVGAGALSKSHLPKEITHLEDTLFGVNALVYDDTHTVIFTACGDPNMLSRAESKLANTKWPWESQKKGSAGSGTQLVPVGSLSCWKEQQSIYKLACQLLFETEVACVAWDPARRYVFIGLDSGKICVYFINEAFSELNLVKSLNGWHTERVVSVVYDKQKDVLITASRDKKMLIFSCKNFEKIGESTCGKAWLSCLALDSVNNRALIGNYAQQILVYDLSSTPNPTFVHTLAGHTGSIRCLMYVEKEKLVLSSGFDSISGLWELADPKEVSKSRSIGWLTGGPAQKIKSIAYYSAAQQVLTGLENGGICIWQVGDGGGGSSGGGVGGRLLHVLSGAHTDAVVSLEFVEHKRMLISGSRDGRVKLWQFPRPDGKSDVQPFTAAAGVGVGSGAGAKQQDTKTVEIKNKPPLPPLPPVPSNAAKPAAAAAAAAKPAQQQQQAAPPQQSSIVVTEEANPFGDGAPAANPSSILHDLDQN